MPDRNYWNSTFDFVGHTGYQDQSIYKYEQPLRMRFVRKVLGLFIQKDANALDIGCGSGDVIAVLREHGSRVLGIDISDTAVESTRIRFSNFTRRCFGRSSLRYNNCDIRGPYKNRMKLGV